MSKNSAETILLADTSKVGKRYTYKGFDLACIDYVVMDKLPEDAALVKALGKNWPSQSRKKTAPDLIKIRC